MTTNAKDRPQLLNLSPTAQLRAGKLPRRLVQLFVGLSFFGVSMALVIRGGLGMFPWDVFHYGVASRVPLSIGTIILLTGIAVLLLWIPIRQAPGVGTIANTVWIGIATDVALLVIPEANGLLVGVIYTLVGIVLNGMCTAMYIGSQLGPGPRDGLMTGIARKTGWSIRLVRTVIEVVVVSIGWLLGGIVGLGTVAFALSIGPLTQFFLPYFTVELDPAKLAVEVLR